MLTLSSKQHCNFEHVLRKKWWSQCYERLKPGSNSYGVRSYPEWALCIPHKVRYMYLHHDDHLSSFLFVYIDINRKWRQYMRIMGCREWYNVTEFSRTSRRCYERWHITYRVLQHFCIRGKICLATFLGMKLMSYC